MKQLKFWLPVLLVFYSGATLETRPADTEKFIARCYGYSPCNACSNCSACKHCNAGGTCGVCEKKVKSKPQPVKSGSGSSTQSSQCKATTKKGTRCSRGSRSGGYCWQHGG